MELKSVLLWVAFISFLLFGGIYLIAFEIRRREEKKAGELGVKAAAPSGFLSGLKTVVATLLLRSYAISMKIPPLRLYVLKVRGRISLLQTSDEFELRRQVMKLVYLLLGISGTGIIALTLMHPNMLFFLTVIITVAVIHGLMLEAYVARLEKKLLLQMLRWFTAVRHAYHAHEMVADAIDEANDSLSEEIVRHGERIYEALTSAEPDKELDRYYETAPTRFLKGFASISRLIMEYGDRKDAQQGSLYLRGISSLTGEIQLELMRRSKLDYLLKGLSLIALAPIFFTKPIELWARRNFPLMDQFYLSKLGISIHIGLFIIILLSYILLQKLKSEEATAYRAGSDVSSWEAKAYRWKIARMIVSWFCPPPGSVRYDRIADLLKDTNQTLRVELLQVRRTAIFVGCLLVIGCSISWTHWKSREWIIAEPPTSYVFLGSLSKEEAKDAREMAELDRQVLRSPGMSVAANDEAIAQIVTSAAKELGLKLDEGKTIAIAQRIMDKLARYQAEYWKWWEVMLAFILPLLGYYSPIWTLRFQRRLRLTDMRHEVYQFQTMIMILREFERISVEAILEWLYSYALIFRAPIEKCLAHYSAGAQEALLGLKDETALEEFQRLIEHLIQAEEKIPVRKAFDDLQSEMGFQFERRRLEYEKDLDRKAEMGRMIGFAPMYSLIFAYLVVPLIWMSFKQMDVYFQQIQNL
ncbi:hypothetical protein DMN77_22640 [Paenibacillus sp. 79R4]|uniref:hypothetical protein n=1 Tax=Paenibacillus sp. 79R4 TaxID=2212847 RepID=UPI0015BF49D2|nr:hypothetical protein [Paenibacillus sp. 79R4]NWL90354.1 hypothetical protein [Paenibacillus sp. 79R4]